MVVWGIFLLGGCIVLRYHKTDLRPFINFEVWAENCVHGVLQLSSACTPRTGISQEVVGPTHVTNDLRTHAKRTSQTRAPTAVMHTHFSRLGAYRFLVLSVRTFFLSVRNFVFVRTDAFVCLYG